MIVYLLIEAALCIGVPLLLMTPAWRTPRWFSWGGWMVAAACVAAVVGLSEAGPSAVPELGGYWPEDLPRTPVLFAGLALVCLCIAVIVGRREMSGPGVRDRRVWLTAAAVFAGAAPVVVAYFYVSLLFAWWD